MFAATDTALQVLNNALVRQDDIDTEHCFRLLPGEEGLHLAVASPTSDDATFSFDGQTVLALPKSMKSELADRTLDIDANGKLFLR